MLNKQLFGANYFILGLFYGKEVVEKILVFLLIYSAHNLLQIPFKLHNMKTSRLAHSISL